MSKSASDVTCCLWQKRAGDVRLADKSGSRVERSQQARSNAVHAGCYTRSQQGQPAPLALTTYHRYFIFVCSINEHKFSTKLDCGTLFEAKYCPRVSACTVSCTQRNPCDLDLWEWRSILISFLEVVEIHVSSKFH